METGVVTTEGTPSASVAVPIPEGALISVSQMGGDTMARLMRQTSSAALRQFMERDAIPHADELRDADVDTKVTALNRFGTGNLPLNEGVLFLTQVTAAMRAFYSAKHFGGEEFRLYYHSCAEVMRGKALRPLPACLSAQKTLGFCLTGPSMMGRSTLIKQLAEFLGPPFRIYGSPPAPRAMWVKPSFVLKYPTCGTPKGLFRDMRQTILAEFGDEKTDLNALSDLEGANGENVAIALCTLLNVGVFILDGAGWDDINFRTTALFRFLVKLREHTGIPIVISGTSAFMYAASNTLASNLLNGPQLHLDPFMPPVPQPTEGKRVEDTGIWRQYVAWLWAQGLLPRGSKMPRHLPEWTYEATLGRLGWLVQGFHTLHVALVKMPDLKIAETVTQEFVTNIFGLALRVFANPMRLILQLENGAPTAGKISFLRSADHFPSVAFENTTLNTWMEETLVRRGLV
ncbi:hypothetical protein HBH1_02095 [Herbaspirillum sp. BH-1]|uniref:hypothetical protein n=1 Tax=Herbaspirillum sp. (strain BH-1) TaxID=2058884 RepID=UPI000CC26F6C|nr:hypothetical protein [Herbaspirillum sp. BH-1]PLY59585.1 hypothetical protein HBH1_02095 [Herbaspirillum sp. BH-1]